MRKNLLMGVAFGALLIPGAAFAQSTGSVDFDNDIVVTGTRDGAVGGIQSPDTAKAKAVLTQEFIARQAPGQSVDDIINQLPGVSFQNNDPFGSAGGTLTIRGFSADRISQTFDGIPLNDTGNYAIYSSQQLDPELIEQVNVSLGSTDVDSPTAAASGSTVNYRTIVPTDDFGARLLGSIGDYNFFRVFGVVNTGEFTPFGTKAFFAASHAENDNVFGHRGKIDKQQYNARIYQPIGSNGDFVSISGNYNESRNNFFGSLPLRTDAGRTVGELSSQRFPTNRAERDYTIAPCQVDVAQAGVADSPNFCGSNFSERTNPSNTGNVRINSRFTLADGLVLSIDPSFQYVKANGGGTATGREGLRDVDPGAGTTLLSGFFGGSPYAGIDLNGDGDLLDQVRVLTPSQTQTRRYGVIASLRYDFSDTQSVRVGYSYDRGHHRQTGQVGYIQQNGVPFDVFPVNNPIIAASGLALQKRDRLSIALLNQVYGEYRGSFFDEKLTITAGVTAKFFKRDLNNYCFTSSSSGFVECSGGDSAIDSTIAALNPYVVDAAGNVISGFSPPGQRTLKYDRVLPSAGLTYKITPSFSLYGSYSEGIQVPSTDNLYNAYYFPVGSASATPDPETTDNFDGGIRYTSSKIQAQVGPWYTRYSNRLASAYDPVTDKTIYRNLGVVDKYGVDGSIAYHPIPNALLYVFGSYLKSKIKDDVLTGTTGAGVPIFAPTAGKRESGAPVYTFGGRAQYSVGPLELGVQAKRTGKRYINDQNTPVFQTISGAQVAVYGKTAPAYTLVDLDARVKLGFLGLNDTTYLQLNVSNVFDKFYVGGFSSSFSNTSVPFAQIGAPRAFIGSINVQF